MNKKRVFTQETDEPCQARELYHLLNQYQDNELDTVRRETVTVHLHTCPTCRAQLDALEQVTSRLRLLPEIETNPYFTTQLMAKVTQQSRQRKPWYVSFAFPSLLYSLVFLVFFGLSVWGIGLISQPSLFPTSKNVNPPVVEMDFAQVLSQSQQLSLLQVQDHSFDILSQNGPTVTPIPGSQGE